MSKKFYEGEQFEVLKDEWYQKLENEGFVDIEKSEDEYMTRPQVIHVNSKFSGGLDYYHYCQTILAVFPFKREIDRLVFDLHAEGKSEREIESWTKERTYKPLSDSRIRQIIFAIKEEFEKLP